MSKISREIELLYYLKDHKDRFVTSKELAEYFEMEERQIRRYIDDLVQANISIYSKPGANGGHKLDLEVAKNLSKYENEVILMMLRSKNKTDSFKLIFDRATKINELINKELIIDNASSDIVNIETILTLIEAILENKFVIFDYKKYPRLKVLPYYIVFERNYYYLHGTFNGELRNYIIQDIKNLSILNQTQKKDELIIEKEKVIFNSYGHYQNLERPIKIKIKVLNDKYYDLPRNFDYKGKQEGDIYTVDCLNLDDIVAPILNLKDNIVVLEPESLKEKIKETLNKLNNLYKK